MEKFMMDFNYKDDDQASVWQFGDYLKKTCMCMRDSDKKWEFVCLIDDLQGKEHPTPQVHAKQLENIANDLGKHLIERPFDNHFLIEKKEK